MCSCDHLSGCSTMNIIEFLFEGVFSTVIGIFGIFGNIAAIVYYNRKRQSSLNGLFHGLMTALAVYDLIIIVSMLLLISIPKFFCDFKGSGFYQNFAPWILFIGHIGLEGSIYMTVSISIERYLVICQPMIYRSKWWPTKAFVIPITCFAIFFCIPKLFELEPKAHYQIKNISNITKDCYHTMLMLNLGQNYEKNDNEMNESCSLWADFKFGSDVISLDDVSSNCTYHLGDFLKKTTISTLVPTQLRLNPCYYQIYIVWLNIVFNAFLPFLVLIILNSYILRHLILNENRGNSRQSSRRVSRESSRLRIHLHPTQMRRRESKVLMAKVSLLIVFVFITCHSVKWIPNIYEFFWVMACQKTIILHIIFHYISEIIKNPRMLSTMN